MGGVEAPPVVAVVAAVALAAARAEAQPVRGPPAFRPPRYRERAFVWGPVVVSTAASRCRRETST